MTVSEVVLVRRELHRVHEELDAAAEANRSLQAANEALRLENADAQAELAQWSKRYGDLERRFADLERGTARPREALQEGRPGGAAGGPEDGARPVLENEEMRESMGRMEGELEEYRRKYARVSNAHTPPSSGSEAQGQLARYRKENAANYREENEERKAVERKRRRKGRFGWVFGRGGGRGRSARPIGLSIPTRREDHTTRKCGTCGSPDIRVRTETKDVIDTVAVPQVVKTQHRMSRGRCRNGHRIDTTPPGLTRGSSFGPHIMTFIVCMFFQTLSLGRIADCLAIMGVPDVSKAAVLNALRAAAVQKFGPRAAYISGRLKDSWFLMADETPIRIGKSRGYAWVFIGQYGIKVVVAPSRGRIVLDMHCPYFHMPITVDGYAVYGPFERLRRCWAHVLRDAELLAARHGGSMAELHQRLQSTYRGAKRLPPDTGGEELQGWVDGVTRIADAYTQLGYDYGEKLRNAAPHLFTFVQHPGMEPTNNRSERSLRPVVLHKKIRLMFRTPAGMKVYGTLMTCLLTWDDQGHNLTEKVYKTIMSS